MYVYAYMCVYIDSLLFPGKSRSSSHFEQLSKKLHSMGYSRDDTDVHDGPVSPPRKSVTLVSWLHFFLVMVASKQER